MTTTDKTPNTITCKECEGFDIEVKEGVDFDAFLKSCDMVKCADCEGLLCDECGRIGLEDRKSICHDCENDRMQDSRTDHEISMHGGR